MSSSEMKLNKNLLHPLSRPLNSSPFLLPLRPFSALSPTEKNKSKNSSKSSPFEFNKRRADGFDETGKNKKNLERKTCKLNPNTTAQVLGTGMDTQDTSSSVLLFFEKHKFIFNAGEGLQRFCTKHKIKLSKS